MLPARDVVIRVVNVSGKQGLLATLHELVVRVATVRRQVFTKSKWGAMVRGCPWTFHSVPKHLGDCFDLLMSPASSLKSFCRCTRATV